MGLAERLKAIRKENAASKRKFVPRTTQIEQVKTVTQRNERGQLVEIARSTCGGKGTAQQAEQDVQKRHSKPVESTATQRAVAYQASAEFTSEALHAGGAQRPNKDSISLRPSREASNITWERQNLDRELAALKEQKKEQAQQKRIALVAEKSAQGLAEVVVGCVVTLHDIEADETISYYVLSDEKEYKGKQRVFVESYDTPPYGADDCLRAGVGLGLAVVGAFVGQVVEARVPAGVLMFRVVSVTNHTGGKPNEFATAPHREISEGQTHARIGSEAYAFLARDNGSFGSFVSHDDYSDEADAEVHGAEAYENERELADDYD